MAGWWGMWRAVNRSFLVEWLHPVLWWRPPGCRKSMRTWPVKLPPLQAELICSYWGSWMRDFWFVLAFSSVSGRE